MRAQLHALSCKDLISRRALQPVTQICGENMHGKRRRHARKVDEAASYGYCAPVKLIEEQKAEEERHHDADALDEGKQRRREHPAPVFARKLQYPNKKFYHTAPPSVPTTFHAALSSEICQSRL